VENSNSRHWMQVLHLRYVLSDKTSSSDVLEKAIDRTQTGTRAKRRMWDWKWERDWEKQDTKDKQEGDVTETHTKAGRMQIQIKGGGCRGDDMHVN